MPIVLILGKTAFACCAPGEALTNVQIDELSASLPIHQANDFEAHTLFPANVQNKVHKTDDQTKTKLAPPQRDNCIKTKKPSWKDFDSNQSYDLVPNMVEKDALVYFGPQKFATRRQEVF